MSEYNIINVAKDLVTGNASYVDEVTKSKRLEICQSCADRNAVLEVCKVCFCWIPGKVKFTESKCPVSKW